MKRLGRILVEAFFGSGRFFRTGEIERNDMASAAPKDVAFKIAVQFESREDGGLRAYSDDVPGFVLSNVSCDVVLKGVVPVLETILSDMFNSAIRVVPLHDMAELRDGLEDAGIIRRYPKPRERMEYVTQLAA